MAKLNDIQWYQFPFRLPTDETITDKFFIESRRKRSARRVNVTSRLTIQPGRTGRVHIEMETTVAPSINGGRVLARIELVKKGQKKAIAVDDYVVTTSERRTRSRMMPRKTLNADEIADVSQVNVTHYPAPWSEPELENGPGPVDITTGKKHVLLVPGLLGDTRAFKDIRDLLEKERDITAQIWDWTDLWEKPNRLRTQVEINDRIRVIGTRLAKRLNEWRRQNTTAQDVYVIALSAGTNIITVACEAKDNNAFLIQNPSRRRKFFNKIVYLSGALSVRHPLDDVARCTEDIYNYYSDKDKTLTVA